MPSPVVLNVYDLTTQVNSWTYWCGVGVFHAGVEVYGIEYAYGGKAQGCHDVFMLLQVASQLSFPFMQAMIMMCQAFLPPGHARPQEQV